MRISKKWKLYLVRLGLLLFGCFLALLLAEGIVRLFYPHARDHVVPGGLFEIDDSLGWRLNPDLNATHRSQYFNVDYETNALGYRDRPRDPNKRSNTYRITLYGDSQIFGWGSRRDRRFSDLLEDRVPSLEVWNLGVPGYGLDQQILAYEADGDALRPDEVIFFVSKVTLNRNRVDYIFRKYKPKFFLDGNGELSVKAVPKGKNSGLRIVYKVLSPFYLPYFLDRQLAALKSKVNNAKREGQPNRPNYDVEIGEFERKLLERARDMALKRNHRLTVLASLAEEPRKVMQFLCEQADIQMVATTFRVDDPDRFFGKQDHHWTHETHKMVADQLLPLLEERVIKE